MDWYSTPAADALPSSCVTCAMYLSISVKVPTFYRGLLILVSQFHEHKNTSRNFLGLICMLMVIHCLSTFQNLWHEQAVFKVASRRPSFTHFLRSGIFHGSGFSIFGRPGTSNRRVDIAFGICLYPCFMWIAVKNPRQKGAMLWNNTVLGCLGSATWNLPDKARLGAIWRDRQGWEPWCKIGTIRSHGDRSMATGNYGASRHGCEHRAGVGLGQVVSSMRTWTTRFVMLGYS
ncbi:unnamed protein product [Malus baccata var. baccata]